MAQEGGEGNSYVMNWRIDAVIQKALSITPGGVAVNDWLRKKAGANREGGRLGSYSAKNERAGFPRCR